MFWIGPLIEFGGQERYELDGTTSAIHSHHDYLVGMDSDVKKDLTVYPYLVQYNLNE